MHYSAIALIRRAAICRSIGATARRGCMKAVVTDKSFDWGDDRPPNVPWSSTVIYEAHIRGMSLLRRSAPTNAAHSPRSAIRKQSAICDRSESPRWNYCPSTPSCRIES